MDRVHTTVVTKQSPWSVSDTVARLSAVAVARGMKVFAVIDHGAEARSAGLELPDTQVVIMGNAGASTPLIACERLVALDLPLKVVVWADGCETNVSYTAPGALAARYGLGPDLADRLAGVHVVTDVAIDR